jgi:hypothetical protein
MMAELVIADRFRGPPASGNGGYVAGRIAAYVDAPAVQVRLQAPPPLERPLAVVAAGDAVELRDGDTVVAVARAATLDLALPAAVSVEAAAAAQKRPLWSVDDHPYPTCFGCGPLREPGDALAHHCGAVAHGVVACVATTDPALPLEDGALAPAVVWSALDCPGAVAAIPPRASPHMLGTLTARLDRPVRAGEPHVCVAWPLGADGRKKRAGSAVLDAGGRVCAIAEALWIELRP